ncbi:hypothetical protein, partial [Kitasatospora purpeofusca]|uniref:hypothetical protein n=1 Tax=Kitasatospora purpeofusca TaxID=67352 RepID=UPI0036676345
IVAGLEHQHRQAELGERVDQVVRSASKAPTFPVGAFVVLPPRSSPAALMRFVMSSDDSAHCSRAGSGGNLEA